MFNNKEKPKVYQVSQGDVAEISNFAQAKWLVQQAYKYIFTGFDRDMREAMNNIVAKLSINTEENDVDWASLFKDGKIYVHKKIKPQPQPEKKDAK